MHAVLVAFRPAGMSQEGFRELADEVAPAFGAIPGLISKVWLDSPDPSVPSGGGFYLFERREDAEAYLASDLFRSGVLDNPHLTDIEVQSVPVLDGPTALTSPGLAGVAA